MTFHLKIGKFRDSQKLILPKGFSDSRSENTANRTADINCTTCTLFSECNNQKKGYYHICGSYSNTIAKKKSFDPVDDFLSDSRDLIQLPPTLNKSGSLSELEKIKIKSDNDLDLLLDRITTEFSSGLPKDFKIDDGDLPLAKNFVDWSINPRFTGDDPEFPFAKQVEIMVNFYTEYCHNPKCTDVSYMKCIPVDAKIEEILSKSSLLEHGVCPKCKQTRLDIWNNPDYGAKRFNEMMGIAGQRGGKTAVVNRKNGYHSHRMFKLNRPHKVFGIEPNKMIENTFTATTYTKAKSNLFDPLAFAFKTNPWFIEYNKMLDHYSAKYGEELYKILNETILYRHRGYLYYAYSPSPANMRGATRMIADIDEYSHLYAKTADAKNLNPHEVRNSLRNSLSTLRVAYTEVLKKGFFDVPSPIMCNITSPRSFNDEGMRLARLSESPKSRIYSFHYSVFEMNPHYNTPEGREEMAEIERDNPEDFKRDFLAVPPNSANAFIENKNVVKASIVKDHVNAVDLKWYNVKGPSKAIKSISAEYTIRKNKKVDLTTPKVMALDGGLNNNSFAISVGHLHEEKYSNGDIRTTRLFDILGEVIPRDGKYINYPELYEDVIGPLIEDFNVVFVCADRWNSIHVLQQIEKDFNIPWEQYQLKYKDFLEFKNGLISGDIGFPMPELKIDDAFELATNNYPVSMDGKPVAHTLLQMLTVQNLMGKKIDKGEGFTDDIFRTIVLGNTMMVDEEIREELLSAPKQNFTNNVVGVVGGMAGGITSIGGANITPQASGGDMGTVSGAGAIGSYSPWGSRI